MLLVEPKTHSVRSSACKGFTHTSANKIRFLAASSLFAFRQSIIVSIRGLGFWRAIWPSEDISWSKFGSTPGPQTRSTRASGWPRSVMHWLIFWSVCSMNWLCGISLLCTKYVRAAHSGEKMMQRIFAHCLQLVRVLVVTGLRPMVVMTLPRRSPALHSFQLACSRSVENRPVIRNYCCSGTGVASHSTARRV